MDRTSDNFYLFLMQQTLKSAKSKYKHYGYYSEMAKLLARKRDAQLNSKNHCCEGMKYNVEFIKTPIVYLQETREYYIPWIGGAGETWLEHCFCCGAKLPKPLSKEWYDTLEKEYGITDPENKEQSKLIPSEFQTDEWWKKRGL